MQVSCWKHDQFQIPRTILHTYVHKKKGGKIKYMFSKLIDGVHPTIDLSRSWFKHIEKVVSENEKNLFVMDI